MARYVRRISSDGRVSLPLELRKHLRAKPGDHLVFEVDERGKVSLHVNRFEKYRGVGAGDLHSMEDVNRWVRELRGHDEWDDAQG